MFLILHKLHPEHFPSPSPTSTTRSHTMPIGLDSNGITKQSSCTSNENVLGQFPFVLCVLCSFIFILLFFFAMTTILLHYPPFQPRKCEHQPKTNKCSGLQIHYLFLCAISTRNEIKFKQCHGFNGRWKIEKRVNKLARSLKDMWQV